MVQSGMNELTEQPNEDHLPEEIKTLFARIAKKKKKRIRDIVLFFAIQVGCFLLMLSLPHDEQGLRFGNRLILTMFVLDGVFLPFLVYRDRKGIYGFNAREIEQIAACPYQGILGMVIDQSRMVRRFAYSPSRIKLLKRLLSRISPETPPHLTSKQVRQLMSLISPLGAGATFEILQALAIIGDASTLTAFKRWRMSETIVAMNPKVTAAYKSCLAAIEARAASTRSESQLLRPSSSTDGADTYLRPVTQKIDENAETLLRSDLTPRFPLPVPSCLGEEGEIHEETVGEDRTKGKS